MGTWGVSNPSRSLWGRRARWKWPPCTISALTSRACGPRRKSARRARSLDGFLNDNPQPATAVADHKIAFGRRCQQQDLVVASGPWIEVRGCYDKPHFLTYGDPVLCVNAGGPAGGRRAIGETNAKDGYKN